jgi:hypothetical protein
MATINGTMKIGGFPKLALLNQYIANPNFPNIFQGNHIYASVQYEASNDSYTMFITCQETGFSVYSNIACEDGKIFTDLYFVVVIF